MVSFLSRTVVAAARFNAVSRFQATRAMSVAPMDASKLTIERTKSPKAKSPHETLQFGHEFSDHMLEIEWNKNDGWGAPRIVPYHNFALDPSASVLHYANELFEGMKAYKDAEHNVRLFRPDKNMERMNNSAARMAMPTFDGEQALECIKELVRVDADWIPEHRGYSLYLRPTMISTQPWLGVGPSEQCLFFVILSPVGPYYKSGFAPVKLLASDGEYVRAFPGGTGAAKCGGNYGATILPQIEANKRGFAQVMWLFGEDDLVTEVGTMNQFFFWVNEQGEKELVTAPLGDGTILPGVTRLSVLELAREWNEFKVTERWVKMAEVVKACDEGRMIEAFGAGTAAIVSPVEGIHYKGKDLVIPLDKNDPSAKIGPLTKRFADTIMDIQYGVLESPWSVKL